MSNASNSTPNQQNLLIALESAIYNRQIDIIPLLTRNLECTTPEIIEAFSDAAAILLKFEEWDDVINIGKKAFASNAFHINILDALSHAYGAKQDWAHCGIYGSISLQLRDAEVMKDHKTLPQLPRKTENQGKNIVSFSLFGDKSAYIEPSILNAELMDKVYPGWVCRFYVDDSVPQKAIERLEKNNVEIIRVSKEYAFLPQTMWRFLAMDDPEANYILFRDADSVISQREAAAVAEWIESGKRFHTIRDSGSHTELILAGLWGAKAGSVPNMLEKMKEYMHKNPKHHRFSDQYFLRECIWPYLKQDVYASDRLFGFMQAHPMPQKEFFNYDITHIGCDEGASAFNLQTKDPEELPIGTKVIWKLFTKIDGHLNEDLSHNLVEERFICEYVSIVEKAGVFSGNIPRRYTRGFSDNTSRIEYKKIAE